MSCGGVTQAAGTLCPRRTGAYGIRSLVTLVCKAPGMHPHAVRPGGRTMFERFTDRARRVVVLAQEEAKMLNHNYIGTEHILLGLIHEGEGVAAKALESLG